ncbi:MAG: thiamine phosphate synthase [Gammaproteobacteria bacterium]
MDELRLSLVTDRTQTLGRDLVAVVDACLAAGLPAVQVREKDLSAAELATLCRRLREPTRAHGALLIVNDRADVALAVGADAVQRTHASLSVADLRVVCRGDRDGDSSRGRPALGGRRLRIGASVHSLDDALAAEADGADWIVFGPIYDTASKRRYGAPQGLIKLQQVTAVVKIPLIAIGGITPERVAEVVASGAHGVAAISAILSADSPAVATKRFLDALAAA